MENIFAYWKTFRSRAMTEDDVLYHLGFEGEEIFCGIQNRHVGLYEIGFAPIEQIDKQRASICNNCFKKYLKLKENDNK